MPLTITDIRKQAIIRSLFPPTTLEQAIRRLGFVQMDPISAPARAQDLILRHRVEHYRAGDLERQYPDLPIDEEIIHVYGCTPSETLGLLHPRQGTWRVEQECPGLAEQVLAFLRSHGPAAHRDLEAQFGAARTMGNWGSQAKATTKILELLHYRGLIRVARREGNLRTYVATSPRQPELPPEERLRRVVLLLARLYAPVPLTTLRTLVRSLRWAAPSLTGVETAVADLIAAGELAEASVEKLRYLWPAGDWQAGEIPRRVALLAPFDPLVWDRRRFEHLWDWPYRFEAYTPPAKRQWGYYALPLLWVDQVVGWANLTWQHGRLEADIQFVGDRPKGPDFDQALAAELADMTRFLQEAR